MEDRFRLMVRIEEGWIYLNVSRMCVIVYLRFGKGSEALFRIIVITNCV